MARRLLRTASPGLVLLAGCGKSLPPSGAQSTSLHPGRSGSGYPLLAMGYNLSRGELTGTACFEGFDVVADGTAASSLSVKADLDAGALHETLSGQFGMTIPVYPGIEAVGALRLARQFAKNDFSSNLVLSLRGRTSGFSVIPQGANIRLTRAAKRILREIPDATSRRQAYARMCGQEYVSHMERGISLVAALKVEFQNEFDRRAFGGDLGARLLGGLVDLKVGTDLEQIVQKSGVKITITALQEGGKPDSLNQIVGMDGTGNQSAFLECSANGNLKKTGDEGSGGNSCLRIFNNIVRYAHELHSQINSGTYSELENSNDAVLRFETLRYPPLPELAELGADETEIHKVEALNELLRPVRKRLAETQAKAEADLKRLTEILERLEGVYGNAAHPVLAPLNRSLERVHEALERAAETNLLCWDDDLGGSPALVSLCQEEAQKLLKDLDPTGKLWVNPGDLAPPPLDFSLWCQLAQSEEDAGALSPAPLRTVKAILGSLGLGETQTPSGCQQASSDASRMAKVVLAGQRLSDTEPLATLLGAREIDLSQNNVSDLKGLSFLPDLERLNLGNNDLRSMVSLVNMGAREPKELILGGNLIADAESALASPMFAWKRVDLSRNGITQIQLPVRAINLEYLDLSNNESLWDVSGLSGITAETFTLVLGGTQVTHCPFTETATRKCIF